MADAADTSSEANAKRRLSGSDILTFLFLALTGLLIWTLLMPLRGKAGPVTPAPDLSQVLLPFVAIATAIERFWETVFSWYESAVTDASQLIGVSAGSAAWVRTEYRAAEAVVTSLVAALSQKKPDSAGYDKTYAEFQKAETRLLDAQSRLTEGLTSPSYIAIKRAVTLLGSLVIGLLISAGTHLALFRTAGFPLSLRGDVILTGLLIGAGPGPLHQFIGLLQGLRDSVSGLASLAQGSAIKKATEALGQAGNAAGHPPQPTFSPMRVGIVQTEAPDVPAPAPSPAPSVTALSIDRQAQRLLTIKRF